MKTLFFDSHYNAWILHTTSQKVVVQRAEYPYFYPFVLHQLKLQMCAVLQVQNMLCFNVIFVLLSFNLNSFHAKLKIK